MARYVALLRGINVGGSRMIEMADLRACFEGGGLDEVSTYIQSGNVLFTSSDPWRALETRIEGMLMAAFGYDVPVMLRSRSQLRAVVAGAPDGFGTDADRYRDDVIFLKAPLTAARAIDEVRARDEVDRVWAGPGVLYFSRLASRAPQSYLSKITSSPIRQQVTIRNWHTTTKLLRLMDP